MKSERGRPPRPQGADLDACWPRPTAARAAGVASPSSSCSARPSCGVPRSPGSATRDLEELRSHPSPMRRAAVAPRAADRSAWIVHTPPPEARPRPVGRSDRQGRRGRTHKGDALGDRLRRCHRLAASRRGSNRAGRRGRAWSATGDHQIEPAPDRGGRVPHRDREPPGRPRRSHHSGEAGGGAVRGDLVSPSERSKAPTVPSTAAIAAISSCRCC